MDSYSNEGFQVKMQQFEQWLGEFYDDAKQPRSGKGNLRKSTTWLPILYDVRLMKVHLTMLTMSGRSG